MLLSLSMRNKIKFFFFIVTISTIGHISAAIYTPVLPFLARDFQVSTSLVQISVTAYFFGMALPGLFFGYFSDYYGRAKILLVAISISLFGTIICLFAPNIYSIIVGKFIQGLGFSGVGISARAILRDKFTGIDLVRYTSNLVIITSLVIDLSPLIGGFLQQYSGWQTIFVLLIFYIGLTIYMCYQYKDDSPQIRNHESYLNKIWYVSRIILSNYSFLKYNLLAAITYAIFMSFLTVGTFLFQEMVGLTPAKYGINIFGLSFIFMFGAFINSRLLRHFKVEKIIYLGICTMWIVGVLFLLYATVLELNYTRLITGSIMLYIACSLLGSNSNSLAFASIDINVGIAAAVYNTIQVITVSIITALISLFKPTSTLPLAILIIILSIGMTFLVKSKIFVEANLVK